MKKKCSKNKCVSSKNQSFYTCIEYKTPNVLEENITRPHIKHKQLQGSLQGQIATSVLLCVGILAFGRDKPYTNLLHILMPAFM